MADSVKIVQVAASTSGGTQEIAVPGWGVTPKAALFIMSAATADDTPIDHAIMCWGFTDGARDRVIGGFSDDAVGTSDDKRFQDNNECLQFVTDAGAIAEATGIGDGAGSNPGPIANGWRISWGITPPEAYKITAYFFGSASMQVYCGHFSGDGVGVPDDVDVTDPGFEPGVVFCSSVFRSGTPAIDANAMFSFGVCHNGASVVNRSVSWGGRGVRPAAVINAMFSEAYIASAMYNNSQEVQVRLKDFDANGFTGRFETSASGDESIVNYLAIRFGEGESVSSTAGASRRSASGTSGSSSSGSSSAT